MVDGGFRGLPFLHFGLDGEIDHEDGVLLDDADEKNDSNDGDHGKFGASETESEERTDTCGRNRGKNGDGVDVAFVENSENDIDGAERGQQEDQVIRNGFLEGLRGSLKAAVNGGRNVKFALSSFDFADGGAEGNARSDVKRKGDGGIKPLVIYRERCVSRFVMSKRTERDYFAGAGRHVNVIEGFGTLRVIFGKSC